MPAMRGNWASTSANVPCRPGSGDHERGNSSYQVLNRALTRSTTTASVLPYSVALRRSASGRMRPARAGSSAAAMRSSGGALEVRNLAWSRRVVAASPLARAAAAVTSSAPTRRITPMSASAGERFLRSRSHDR